MSSNPNESVEAVARALSDHFYEDWDTDRASWNEAAHAAIAAMPASNEVEQIVVMIRIEAEACSVRSERRYILYALADAIERGDYKPTSDSEGGEA